MKPVMKGVGAAAIADENPYYQGKFAPIDDEIAVEQCRVIGELPADLEGIFLRNSSNPKHKPKGRYHWFDGDGMIHSVQFRDGCAAYRNRYVRTDGYKRELSAGEAMYTGIMERPNFELGEMPFKNTANTDLVYHDGKLLALWWLGGKAHKVRLPDLETLGAFDFCGNLARGIASHPKIDPRTGEMMFFDFSIVPPFMTYGVVSRTGEVVHQTPIELPCARLQHDIAITPNYTLLFDMPFHWDMEALMRGKVKVVFDEHTPARVGIIPRHAHGDNVQWFETAPFFMYHTINAYEEGDEVVLIGCRINNPAPDVELRKDTVPQLSFLYLDPYLCRWRFNLKTGLCREEILDDVPSEFPRTNDTSLGLRQRYSYNPRIAGESELLFDGLIKYDLEKGGSQTHDFGVGVWAGEAAFAPRPNQRSEDDGYLVTFVYDEPRDASELVVLDARDITAGPVARVVIPQRVPIGYHTCWVSAQELAAQKPE